MLNQAFLFCYIFCVRICFFCVLSTITPEGVVAATFVGDALEGAAQAVAQQNGHVALQHRAHVLGVLLEVEGAEEAERAHVHGQHWWTALLRSPEDEFDYKI